MVQGQPVSTTGKPSDQPVGSSHYNGSSNTDSFTHQGRTKCQLISFMCNFVFNHYDHLMNTWRIKYLHSYTAFK